MVGKPNRFGPSNNEVNFWTNTRLQYPPTKIEDQKDLADLREAISNLVYPDGKILVADLTSADDGKGYDAENILFYNVGSGSFSKIAQIGLRFERHLNKISRDPADNEWKYHHR